MKTTSPLETAKLNRKKFAVNSNKLQLYLMCALPMLLFFVFSYLPMFGVYIAFVDFRDTVGFRELFRGLGVHVTHAPQLTVRVILVTRHVQRGNPPAAN